jgi:hypothetical protein
MFWETKMKTAALLAITAALAVPAAWADTNYANGPSGAHYANGYVEPTCASDQNTPLTFTCTGTVIGGVGHTNATVNMSVTYTGTVRCRNHGGQIVDVKTQTTEASNPGKLFPDRNGQLTVPQLTVAAPSTQDLLNAAKCPNPNWTKELLNGPTLKGYVYTLYFDRFTQPFISIVG